MNQVLAVAAGGAIGSVLRFWMSDWVHVLTGRAFPFGTMAVNVLGCLLIGFSFVVFAERLGGSEVWRVGILVGVLGGFTTFSALSLETFQLLEQGAYFKAITYTFGSVALCLGATFAGVMIARQI